jgi:hypothetical protein
LPDARASRADLPLESGEGARRVAASRIVWGFELLGAQRAPRDAARTIERIAASARVWLAFARAPGGCRAAPA